MINGISSLVVTKLDLLDDLVEIPVCEGYKMGGKKISEIPPDAAGYEKLECVYRKMPGWRKSTRALKSWEKLPARAREYLAFPAAETGARIAMVSTGPERDLTIVLENLAKR